MADLTPEPIFQIASGFLAAKHLFVAVEVGLFERLARGPATLLRRFDGVRHAGRPLFTPHSSVRSDV